jgi:hypothetical protein
VTCNDGDKFFEKFRGIGVTKSDRIIYVMIIKMPVKVELSLFFN